MFVSTPESLARMRTAKLGQGKGRKPWNLGASPSAETRVTLSRKRQEYCRKKWEDPNIIARSIQYLAEN